MQHDVKNDVLDRLAGLRTIVDTRGCPFMPEPIVEFYSNKLAAGYAHYRPYKVSFNLPMLMENPESMLHETVAHELAHLVTWYRYSRDIAGQTRPRPHGHEWQYIMRDWFNVEPERCHNYDTSTTNARRQHRHRYLCSSGCVEHKISTTKAMKIAMGRRSYRCSRCKSTIYAAPEGE